LIGGLVHPVFTDTFSAHYSENLSRRLALDMTREVPSGQVGNGFHDGRTGTGPTTLKFD
jgi:hypothetical protein